VALGLILDLEEKNKQKMMKFLKIHFKIAKSLHHQSLCNLFKSSLKQIKYKINNQFSKYKKDLLRILDLMLIVLSIIIYF
jgi:hypothetical protein